MLSRGILHFEYSSVIPASVAEVWAFHERPDALQMLTPPGQRLQLLSRRGGLEASAEIVVRMKLWGPVSARWVAVHTACVPEVYFVDEQREGPFHFWRHRHSFSTVPGGMRLTDSIDFQPPLVPLSGWLVRRQLQSMFAWRHAITRAAVAGPLA